MKQSTYAYYAAGKQQITGDEFNVAVVGSVVLAFYALIEDTKKYIKIL